ncbi:MAG: metallophosphoesterase [Anaerolineales bacterium]|nr:metallophosphoesterase [Anaerolineales bacterium]
MKRPVITRRAFLKLSGASLAAVAGLGLYARWLEPHWLEVVRRQLPINRLPDRLAGKTLAHISDVHVGPRVANDYLVSVFQRLAALNPDFVVFTGDFISYHPGVFAEIPLAFQFFPKGRLGTLAVLGNHDYGPAWSHPEIAGRVVASVQQFGITVLRNQVLEVEGLQIAGLDDLWGPQFRLAPTLAALDPAKASIVLSHNPDTVDLPGWSGYHGWILSGHTHGGQCKPPFLPPPLLPVRNRRYTAGEFLLAGNRRLYINRGVGHLLEVRFNARPEVTLFELTAA